MSQNWSLRSLPRALNQIESEVQQFVANTMEGNTNNMPSYRPISLTSSLSKIMETVVLARLQAYIEWNKLMDAEQDSFRKEPVMQSYG